MDSQAFYTQTGPGEFDSSPLTAGPWSASSQHGGPPSALLVREIECYQPRDGHRLARVSVDILTPVPVAPLTISVAELRTGKRVQLLEATAQAAGRTVLIGRAWRIAAASADFPAGAPELVPGGVKPTAQDRMFPQAWHSGGYLSAIDWCFEAGSFAADGPARAWARPTVALVDGEPMTAWQRVLTVGDSGSGISACAPPEEYPAINCDFSVVLHRDPVGEWIGMDSRTVVTPGAGALTQTTVFDAAGMAGLATQTLVV